MAHPKTWQTIILGAGAAGMMAASHAGPGVLVIDHARAPGEKIRISGGGRCNFTNLGCAPDRFLSANPHFAKSALSRYSAWDFLSLVEAHGIAWHEKTLGQLFCDDKATQIVDMLRREMAQAGAQLWLNTALRDLQQGADGFTLTVERDGETRIVQCQSLIVATGGKSIPKMGATGLAYDIARQFGHDVTETRAGLVPFTFDKGRFAALSGVSTPVRATVAQTAFDEAMLFTHRGLSGPAMLQLSSYWREGQDITLDLLPDQNVSARLQSARTAHPRRALRTELANLLPARLVDHLAEHSNLTGNLADLSDKRIAGLAADLTGWRLRPTGTEGYRTAEVTLGGIDTAQLSSKTMMSAHLGGLFFIGEAVDVTGWLGGYNFQWAWASGVAAGQAAQDRAQS